MLVRLLYPSPVERPDNKLSSEPFRCSMPLYSIQVENYSLQELARSATFKW